VSVGAKDFSLALYPGSSFLLVAAVNEEEDYHEGYHEGDCDEDDDECFHV
jgi:hypothetical protein